MVPYSPPVDDMRFVLEQVLGRGQLTEVPGFSETTPDMLEAILGEAAKLASNVLAPLNHVGDRQHARWSEGGVVTMPEGFKEAYAQYRDGGWNALPFDPDHGGQGLPWAVAFAVQEMWHASNMSFGLCPTLNQGAVELLQEYGSPSQKKLFLENLISGHWTGTMNLTEPQAGSDLSTVRCVAQPAPDLGENTYRLKGQKIYITYGEHDLAENVIHMVLARTPGAPEGTKGISLFIVPKFTVKDDGSLGERNDVVCTSIEKKLGIAASPTCTMMYGDNSDGAVGYLVGEECQGLKLMFVMMNNARLSVGLEGVGIAARALDQAVAFAKDRVQSKHLAKPKEGPVRIIEHADVRRMLLRMKSLTEAARALTYQAGMYLDLSKLHPDATEAANAKAMVDLLTPVVKAWGTDVGCDVTSLGIQVHGGMGYVEETGAAQHFRDARIAPIYEGTNGIQANDLAFRKVLRDQGQAAGAFLEQVRSVAEALEASDEPQLKAMKPRLSDGCDALEEATRWIVDHGASEPNRVAASAYPYLSAFGYLAGGWMLCRSALALSEDAAAPSAEFREAKLATARFYADHFLPQVRAHLPAVTAGHAVVDEAPESIF